MRMLVISLLVLIATKTVWTDDRAELLNATLVARFHFAEQATDGQMVGAYQVSFRNTTEKPLTSVSILLNPGLRVDQVQGPGGARLQHTSRTAAVAGMSPLELNAVDVRLPKPLTDEVGRFEIVIHYRGYLEDLSVAGLTGVRETLHPDFTMIRAQSFSYPVFASPDKASITKAWNHKPFHQVAFLDIPGSNKAIGNLDVRARTTNGNFTRYEMTADHPTGLMMLPIGPYAVTHDSLVCIGLLPSLHDQETAILDQARLAASKIENHIGRGNAVQLKIATLPTGYDLVTEKGALFIPADITSPASIDEHLQRAFFGLWRTNATGREGHWGAGLDSLLEQLLFDTDMKTRATRRFDAVQNALEANAGMGKTAIADFAVDGFSGAVDDASALAFAVLNQLLSEKDFFTLVRGLRTELSAGYADMQSVADYLDTNLRHRGARKFAENWFQKGRIGKDMKKAENFEELVALYQ